MLYITAPITDDGDLTLHPAAPGLCERDVLAALELKGAAGTNLKRLGRWELERLRDACDEALG